ncbi:MAG: hypothetical protein ACREMO_08665 [Gemmatimonadales bacterium]
MSLTPEDLSAAAAQVEQMHDAGALPAPAYHKCLATLASEHLCRRHDTEAALILLNRCPPDYFRATIAEQMREDQLFADVMLELSYRLVQLGVADGSPVRPTQLPADA